MIAAATSLCVAMNVWHTLPAVFLALLAVGAAAVLHAIRLGSSPQARWALIVGRIAATCGACLLTARAAGAWLRFTSDWPLWLWCILGALAMEAIVALYRFERRGVSRAVGGTLLALRLGLLAIVIFWLAQPIWKTRWTVFDRYIAVLIDDSASMTLVDKQATAREKLDLAPLFSIALPDRPPDIRPPLRRLEKLQREFSDPLGTLEIDATQLAPSASQLDSRIAALKDLVAGAEKPADELNKTLAQIQSGKITLTADTSAALESLVDQLKTMREGPFVRIHNLPASSEETVTSTLEALRGDVRAIAAGLQRIQTSSVGLPRLIDDAYWNSLTAEKRREIDERTTVARSEIARHVLDFKSPEGKSLVKQLRDGYALKFYRFASRPLPVASATYLPDEPGDKAGADGKRPAAAGGQSADKAARVAAPAEVPWRSATDLTAALAQVTKDIPLDHLSGILVLSDGRHNVNDPVSAVTGKLATGHVPVSTVIIGSHNPPKDAAVAGIEVPDTVLVGDKLSLKAALKIDGFRGQQVVARLLRDGKEVDHKTINVPEDHHRTKVEFSQPTKEPGLLDYQVQLQGPDGTALHDAVAQNDQASRQVSVTDDRIKMLILERNPRWEFRYLKNLFTGPDMRVQLQYLLTNATRIEGAPEVPQVRVSASRPFGSFEGTALPENSQEWMKFDVIVLGDLAPDTLDKDVLETLDHFVAQRGGTLIVIAGADYMPHAYENTKLVNMLPVRCSKVKGSLRSPTEIGFQLRLTDEGKESILLRQVGPSDNEQYWKSLPLFRWRHPAVEAKEGASVLAYAEPYDAGLGQAVADRLQSDRLQAEDGGQVPAKRAPGDVDTPQNRQLRERRNALICWQRYGAGKVLMLNFDETWRLRYQVGVKNHNRFWGQVVRWAADDKLSAGTPLVRLGTDRPRYEVGQKVIIKARLVDEKANPVLRDDVVAKVYRGDQLLHTVALAPDPEKTGRYRAELADSLQEGKYRVELSGPTVEELLAKGDQRSVKMEFAVRDARVTSELVELTADEAIPMQTAASTHGLVVAPADVFSLLDHFGPRSGKVLESSSLKLWESWPLLLLFLLLGSGEWIVRKKAGLT